MSPDFDGLVETSTSLGEAITEGDALTLHSLSRSSNDSALPEVIAALDAAARLGRRRARGEAQLQRLAAGPRLARCSPSRGGLRASCSASRRSSRAVHAGLETAVIGSKVSGRLDMLAFGPQIEFPHSPDERVSIPTVERFWQLLVGVVDELLGARAGSDARVRWPGSSPSSPGSWSCSS